MSLTNEQLLKTVIDTMPNMTEQSSKQVLQDWLKNPGKMFTKDDLETKNFLNTLSTFILDSIRIQEFYNPLENEGIVRRYNQSYGMIQRFYIPKINAVDADFQKEWVDGTSSDMFKKRTVKPTEKFAISNISWNNRVSIPGDMFYTTVFSNSGGIVDWNTSILQSMLMSYNRYRFALEMDMIGRQTKSPNLKETQKIGVSVANMSEITEAEAAKIAKQILDFKSTARLNAEAFNEDGFSYSLEPSNIKLLVRVGTKSALQLALKNTFNPEVITNVINMLVEVPYLGVPEYYTDNTMTTKLYPVYNADGAVIGLNQSEGQSEVTVQFDAAFVNDGASNVFAVAIDTNRLNYVYADDGGEVRTEYTIYNVEGNYRNLYMKVNGNPSYGAGARFFADTSYAFVVFENTYKG